MRRLLFRPVALVAFVAASAAIVGAQSPSLAPTSVDRVTARIVVNLLEQGHMARPRINDETSRKWARTFLKDLDPQKYYFEKADIAEFLAKDAELDDKVREGDITFAKTVMERFIRRSDERLKVINELLDIKPDYAVDEVIVDEPDLIDYPADAADARERWRKRIKLELLQRKIEKVDDAEAIRKLKAQYKDRNRFVHQFTNEDVLEIYLSALTKTFDPHSSYLAPRSLEDFTNQSLHLSLEGIGASLAPEEGFAVVKELVPGGPADKDGRIQPEDKILGIQNDDGTEADFIEKKLNDVVRQIRGKAGTHVRLIVQPATTKERVIYDLVRAKVDLVDTHAKGEVVEAKSELGKAVKVGIINLPAFYGDTGAVDRNEPDAVSATKDCRALIEGFKKDGVGAVVVDLRGNGGGLLLEAISLSGLFIDKGPVVQIKESTGVRHLDDDEPGTAWSGPLVVLIDRMSASASEIFAGVIKDYGRGLIIGDVSTFGKGTVQQIIPINEQLGRATPKLGALKLTIQQFYRANGESTQINGVMPDIHIPSSLDVADFGEGKMDNALKFDRVKELPHQRFNLIPANLASRLDALSAKRREASDKFRKVDDRIRKAEARKAKHEISLNEAKFRAEFVPDDRGEDGEKKDDAGKPKPRKRYGNHEVWEKDSFYNDEVLHIIADYLILGSDVLASAPTSRPTRGQP